MTLTGPAPEISRDRFGRPLVTPPEGGKPVAYTRCTTFVDCVEDKFNLQKWQQRMVVRGIALRPDYLLRAQSLGDPVEQQTKKQYDALCEQAIEAAKGSAAATTGTALHALTELIDRGQELPPLPPEVLADLEAYKAATADLKALHIEQFCVQDPLQIGGTPDRIVTLDGERYIADIKTGSIEWGALKIAMQLAVYARSATYDIATGARGVHGASTTKAIIIHLPAGEARCELHWVDLTAGWEGVQVAKRIREVRKLKFTDLTHRVGTERPVPPAPEPDPGPPEANAPVTAEVLEAWIGRLSDPDLIRGLYADHNAIWTDRLTEVARARVTELAEPRKAS